MNKRIVSKNRIVIPFLEGKRIRLRPLQREDINQRYLSWINDREVTRFMETGIFPSSLKELYDFYNKINQSRTDIMLSILLKRKLLHIGNIKLGSINWQHRFAELGIMVGEIKYWGKGYGQEAIHLLLEYAFNRVNLNKVILGVYSPHKSAIRVYKKCGFRIEGIIRDIFYFEGKYVDKVIMGISKKEFSEFYK